MYEILSQLLHPRPQSRLKPFFFPHFSMAEPILSEIPHSKRVPHTGPFLLDILGEKHFVSLSPSLPLNYPSVNKKKKYPELNLENFVSYAPLHTHVSIFKVVRTEEKNFDSQRQPFPSLEAERGDLTA